MDRSKRKKENGFAVKLMLQKRGDVINERSWSPDGRILATIIQNIIELWDLEKNKPLGRLIGHNDQILDIEWSPDGTRLASGSKDYSIRIWDISDCKSLFKLSRHTQHVIGVTWDVNGQYLISIARDNSLCFWNVQRGTLVQRVEIIISDSDRIAWSSDRRYVALYHLDNYLRVWETNSGLQVLQVEQTADISSLCWVPGKNMLAIGTQYHNVHIFDVVQKRNVRLLEGFNSFINILTFTSDGKFLMVKS